MPNEARVKAGVGVHSRCPDLEFVAQRSSLSSSYTERSDAPQDAQTAMGTAAVLQVESG